MIIAVQDVFLQLAIMGTPYVAGKSLLSLPMAAPVWFRVIEHWHWAACGSRIASTIVQKQTERFRTSLRFMCEGVLARRLSWDL
jgi:hypothetical protein